MAVICILYRRIVSIVILLAPTLTIHAQPWTLVKEKNGIYVYTRPDKTSSFKDFKGTADVNGTMDKVFAIVGDVKSTDNWDPGVKEMKVLTYEKGKSFSYYLVYSLPWPLHNRDLCVKVKILHDSATGKILVDAISDPTLVPEKPDLVRIKSYWQKWIIEPVDSLHQRLTLEGFADPAGNIPSWIYNMVITETPLNLIRGVQERVK